MALIVAGLSVFLPFVNSLGFEFEGALAGYLLPVPIVVLGVYVYQRRPFNNIALIVGSILVMVNMVGIFFGFGMGPLNFDPMLSTWLFTGLYLVAAVVVIGATIADGVEGVM